MNFPIRNKRKAFVLNTFECSEQYKKKSGSRLFQTVLGRYKTYIEYLDIEKQRGTKWSDLPNKEDDVYIPLLNAFKGELERQNHLFGKDIPKLMVEYLLGEFDFYKVIGIDSKRTTQIQSYNLRGTLNKQGNKKKRSIELPISTLPTRIVSLGYKPGSKNILELYLDGGWQFSFRIHNA